MTPEDKAWIDAASYEQLLRRWRFAPISDHFFTENGDYYRTVMIAKRDADTEDAAEASRRIGWNPDGS